MKPQIIIDSTFPFVSKVEVLDLSRFKKWGFLITVYNPSHIGFISKNKFQKAEGHWAYLCEPAINNPRGIYVILHFSVQEIEKYLDCCSREMFASKK